MQKKTLGLLHGQRFNHKPAGADINKIKHDLLNSYCEVWLTPEEWLNAALAGQTIEPGICTYPDQKNIPQKGGTREEYFKSQSFFMVDVDNEIEEALKHGATPETPLETPASYKAKLEANGIKPCWGYYSMSSQEWNQKKGRQNPDKFRIAIFTDRPVTDSQEAKRIINGLIALSPFADRQPSNVASIFFGTNKQAIPELIDFEAVTPIENLLALAVQAEQISSRPETLKLSRDENFKLVIPEGFVIHYLSRNTNLFSFGKHHLILYGKEKAEQIRQEYYLLATQYCDPPYDLNNPDDKKELENTWRSAYRYAEKKWNEPGYKPYEEYISRPTPLEDFEDLTKNEPSNGMTAPSTINGIPQRGQADKKLEEVLKQASVFTDAWIDEMRHEIEDKAQFKYISTGIQTFDDLLGGGFYPGLHVLGAETGCGKTTLALQIADYIASCGHDVLFFALEMSRTELFCRSISRMSHQYSKASCGFDEISMEAQEIRSAEKKESWSDETAETLNWLIEQYTDTISKRIKFICGLGDISSDHIEQAIKQHLKPYAEQSPEEEEKHKPFIVVDYLQILDRGGAISDKEKTDQAVMAVKRLANQLKIPVLVISSFNRMSYKEQVDLGAFKESGSIEYTADTVIALQLDGMDLREEDNHRAFRINKLKDEAQQRKLEGKPIWLELKVLKNRSGITGCIPLDYTAKYNHFDEGSEAERKQARDAQKFDISPKSGKKKIYPRA